MHAFSIFVFAPVQRNEACFTWKSALEIRSLLLLLLLFYFLFYFITFPQDWERRYLHADYSKALEERAVIEQPCPDVYWFPIMSDTFCDEFVAVMEASNKWSNGGHSVRRCPAGRCSALLSLAVWWCGCQQVCGRKRERVCVDIV